jgi:hypothetical protein
LLVLSTVTANSRYPWTITSPEPPPKISATVNSMFELSAVADLVRDLGSLDDDNLAQPGPPSTSGCRDAVGVPAA